MKRLPKNKELFILDDEYSVYTHGDNFVLRRYYVTDNINPKTGKHVISQDRTYYTTFLDALLAYSRKKVGLPKDVKECIEAIKETENNIRLAIEESELPYSSSLL